MDYEKLIYTNENGESLVFSPLSTFHCNIANDCTGISDISNTLYTSNSMGQHGDTLISQRIEPREIQLVGYINSRDKDITLQLRRKMQKILNPELNATLMYVYKDFVRVIDCKIDNAPVFTRSKIFQKYVIQLVCPNPFWREEVEQKEDIASWIAALEFELEIPEDEGIEFGYREPSVIVNVYNEGDVKAGMRIEFRATNTLSNPVLLNMDTGEYIQVNATMQAGDIVTITTDYGNKGVTLTRDGTTEDYFRYIDVDSTFMQLDIGDNVFRYDAAAGSDALEVTIYHNNNYLGV